MSYSSEVLADSPTLWLRGDAYASVVTGTSSTNFPGDTPANAFDGNSGTFWTTNAVSTGWLRAEMSAAVALNEYAITGRAGFTGRSPNSWTFEGSNDGSSWTTLDTRSSVTWSGGETKTYTFSNTTAYLYYRLNVSANNGDTYLGLAELTLPLVTDQSGNGRSLTSLSGAAPSATSGGAVLATALEWSSAAGHVRTTYSQTQPTVGTYECWLYFSSNPAADVCLQTFVPDSGGSGGTSAVYLLSTGKIRLFLYTGSSVNLDTASALSTGVWHHVVCSWGAAGSKIRVDKVNGGTGATTATAFNATAFYRTHGYYNGSTNTARTGVLKLAEQVFYPTQLSDARTDAHFDALATNATVTPPAATATAAGVVPVVTAASTVSPPAASASASAPVPMVTTTGDGAVSAPAATASAAGLAPSVSADALVEPPTATAMAAGVVPTVSATANQTVTAPVATATATAIAPFVSNDSPDATIEAPAAHATATALAPTPTLAVGTDTSNTFSGRTRGGSATVEVIVPVVATPASTTRGTRVDKAIALPEPVLVNGRPT